MRKRKTEQEKQKQGDRLLMDINRRIGELHGELNSLEDRKEKVRHVLFRLDDPHAVIPKFYKTMEEWIADNRWPHCLLGHVCDNISMAESFTLMCNTYQESYHIVPCQARGYYEKMLDKR